MLRNSAEQRVSQSARVFAALGDTHRLHLVTRLGNEGPLSITALSADADISRQAITKHLLVLEDAGLVSSVRDGRRQVFSLQRKRLQKAQLHLQTISRQWDSAIERPKSFVEDSASVP